jgi:hypothetical protein
MLRLMGEGLVRNRSWQNLKIFPHKVPVTHAVRISDFTVGKPAVTK